MHRVWAISQMTPIKTASDVTVKVYWCFIAGIEEVLLSEMNVASSDERPLH
jgi:hypothetical protein